MAHVPFRAEIQEVSQGNAIRWNAAEEFYNNQGSNITLQHMSARHIIVFPSANMEVILPDTNTLLDGWQVHVGFPYSTSDNPYEITVKDAAGAEWRKLIKGQWCECVKKGGSWYVYPPGSVADTGTVVPGDPPPQPPTVPSGTVLETDGICTTSSSTASCNGVVLITPVTNAGYIRSFSMSPASPWGSTTFNLYFRIGTITGSTFTTVQQSPVLTTVNNNGCRIITLPTPLPIRVGDCVALLHNRYTSNTGAQQRRPSTAGSRTYHTSLTYTGVPPDVFSFVMQDTADYVPNFSVNVEA